MDNNSPENSNLDFIKGIRDIGDVPYSPSIIPQILDREKGITRKDFELFCQIQRIVTIVGECAKIEEGDEITFKSKFYTCTKYTPNPHNNQTSSGLFLELSYYTESPTCLYTPWGRWDCWDIRNDDGGFFERVMPKISERLGAEEISAKKSTPTYDYGAVYELKEVDGVPLPEAEMRKREDYLFSWEAKRRWELLEKLDNHFRMEKSYGLEGADIVNGGRAMRLRNFYRKDYREEWLANIKCDMFVLEASNTREAVEERLRALLSPDWYLRFDYKNVVDDSGNVMNGRDFSEKYGISGESMSVYRMLRKRL